MRPDFEDIVNRSGGNISVSDAEILYDTALEIKPRCILEIGSREDGSSVSLGLVAKESDGHLICIEPRKVPKWEENIRNSSLGKYVRMIEKASPWVAHDEIGGFPFIDYLFLDGGGSKQISHHTRWMIVDYHYWEPLVRTGGRIAFHDWTGKNGVREQVQRAVNIILETDDLKEVIRNESTDRGIIVFEKRG